MAKNVLVVLVGIQMPENLGAIARAMGNFGLNELHLVHPKCDPTDPKAIAMAAGNEKVLYNAVIHEHLSDAIGVCDYALATSALVRDMHKPLLTPQYAMTNLHAKGYEKIAFVFGPERTGLTNDEIMLCQGMIQIPTDPEFTSLNIAQAGIVLFYEWFKSLHANHTIQPFRANEAAQIHDKTIFLGKLETVLDDRNFWRDPSKKPVMWRNIQNIFMNHDYTKQEIRTLTGVASDLLKKK
ncbi:MAG: RNA methyltransferase [Alphaproteobacteria bacterium]|nr:RNA methyltransferase [Alphaproteobacteria bacterium]